MPEQEQQQPDGSEFQVDRENWGTPESPYDSDGFVKNEVQDPAKTASELDSRMPQEFDDSKVFAAGDGAFQRIENNFVRGATYRDMAELPQHVYDDTEVLRDMASDEENHARWVSNEAEKRFRAIAHERQRIQGEYKDMLSLNPEAIGTLSPVEFVDLVAEQSEMRGKIEGTRRQIDHIDKTVMAALDAYVIKDTPLETDVKGLVGSQLNAIEGSQDFADDIARQMAELRNAQKNGYKAIQEQIKKRLKDQLHDQEASLEEFLDGIRSGNIKKPAEQDQLHQEAS